MKKIFLLVLIACFVVACGNKENKTTVQEETVKIEPVKPEPPKIEPSRYSQPSDTVVIDDLQIILDSVSIHEPDLGHTSRELAKQIKRNNKMLHLHIRITNLGKTTKMIPFAEIVEEKRDRSGMNTVRIGGSDDPEEIRLASRLFIESKKNNFASSVKPKRTLTGAYTMKLKRYKYTAIAFWYRDDEPEAKSKEEKQLRSFVEDKITHGGEGVFKMVIDDFDPGNVGFDITELLSSKKN